MLLVCFYLSVVLFYVFDDFLHLFIGKLDWAVLACALPEFGCLVLCLEGLEVRLDSGLDLRKVKILVILENWVVHFQLDVLALLRVDNLLGQVYFEYV